MNSLFFKGSFVFGCKNINIFKKKYRLRKRLS